MKTNIAQLPGILRHIDNGFYHVSDKSAGQLARASKHRKLPRHGYQIDVTLANGSTAILQRTPVSCVTYTKRRWVWAVFAIRNKIADGI